jgi:hypothetical protein
MITIATSLVASSLIVISHQIVRGKNQDIFLTYRLGINNLGSLDPEIGGRGNVRGLQEKKAMGFRLILKSVIICLALGVVFSSPAGADVVGRLTQVEGRVDLLKGGNLPATLLKVGDTVAPKDVIRTKSLSKAQITFIDNSVLTISPESRIAIEEYMIDTTAGKRRAVLEVFQGLALAVINKIYKVEEPDFIIKTQTAIMGVRGTEFGIRILPNSSTILNFEGRLQVGNIFPEVSQLFRKAFKVAYAFGPLNDQSGRWVFLKNMQGTTVARNLPPTLPYAIADQDREMFMRQLTASVPQGSKLYQGADTGRGSAIPTGPLSAITPVSFNNPGEQTTLALLNTITVPPVVVPQPVSNTSFTFNQQISGSFMGTSSSPFTTANFTNLSVVTGTRDNVYPGNFSATFSINATTSNTTFPSSFAGPFSATTTASVTGQPGGTLTGTMRMNTNLLDPRATVVFSGPVTLKPDGNLTFQPSGSFNVRGMTGTASGSWSQTATHTTTTPTTDAATTSAAPSAIPAGAR